MEHSNSSIFDDYKVSEAISICRDNVLVLDLVGFPDKLF